MANLIVSGAGGRMGRLIVSIMLAEEGHRLVGALEAKGAPVVGRDAGEVAGAGSAGVVITDDYSVLARPDTVTLDFTSGKASLEHLEIAAASGAAIVIGSTGFTPAMEGRAAELARTNPHRHCSEYECWGERAYENQRRNCQNSGEFRRRSNRDSPSH